MSKINEILEGWANYAHLSTDPIEESIAKQRAEICGSCEFSVPSTILKIALPDKSFKEIQGHKCSICTCPLSSKVRSKLSQCPKDKWPK